MQENMSCWVKPRLKSAVKYFHLIVNLIIRLIHFFLHFILPYFVFLTCNLIGQEVKKKK